MRITVDADRMRGISGAIRSVTGSLQYNMDSIEVLVNSMTGEWQGDAARAYASRIIYIRKEFKEVERFLEEYASLLERFAEEYTGHEQQVASKIRNV